MNDMLRLHDRDATDFDTGEVLNDASNVSEQRKINDIACLEFDYPMDDKARLIDVNMLISCEGRKYEVLRIKRKTDGEDVLHVTAEDMFSRRAKHAFLPNISDTIGEKITAVIKKALKIATDFEMFTDAELEDLGMNWVGDDDYKIDFFSTDKTNLWDLLQTIIENLGRGEIYSDGYKFAIVEKIGQDRGVRLSLSKNMQNIDIEFDTENIVTRLYPFGQDDMPITSVNDDVAYIDSDNIGVYGIHEGYKDYSDYEDPAKILANAQWEFNADNEDRIDVPQLTITGDIVDLSKLAEYGDTEKIELGDTVHVYDADGTEYTQRVTEGTWHPYEPETTTVSIGHMRRDLFFTLYQLKQKKNQLSAVQTTNKQITTRSLAGVLNSDRNSVQSDDGLFEIAGALLTVYDESDTSKKRLELGDAGDGFTLNIYDDDGTLRVRLGDKGKTYSFAICDKNGDEAIYMDESGEVIISGSLNTGKDCRIQGELRVGLKGSTEKGITFYGDAYVPDEDGNYSTPYARMLPYVANNEDFKGINVTGGKLCVNGSPVATEDEIENLQRQIKILQDNLT